MIYVSAEEKEKEREKKRKIGRLEEKCTPDERASDR